ncbi:MAG: nodulation protein NfeD [Bacteroidota bacterium]
MISRWSVLVFAVLAFVFSAHAQTVQVISIDATINPATADFIHLGIERAIERNAECLVIRLNTPGGLLKSTRVIVTDLLTARVPVVVYVSPSGAQSASAGAFVTLAAHIAAMAPGTNIGAAHPVGMQGGEKDSIMNEKATNDAAAFIRTISEKRHRNVRWAEDAVRKSISITETEALRDSVIDLVAPNVQELLRAIDGRTVTIDGTERTLHTAGAAVEETEMSWKLKILLILSDPNIAYIFFLLGLYGLIFELYNPGAILPGVVGVISIILAFYSLHTLPVNYAGLALIVFGVILFILEIKITSYGLLTVGGIIALLLGSIMLINSESSLEFVEISWSVIIPAVVCTAAFFLFAIGMGIRAQTRKPVTGVEGIVGETGEAVSALAPAGQVRVHGELWSAATAGEAIPAGSNVVVEKVEGLRLVVRKAT